mmetsp:Transcript_37146/g.61033  ORF Transcript_37146/g.61033 Transcript_37146/m.61033 type:complete len:418 (-) Transcript_37146:63-1316(-)
MSSQDPDLTRIFLQLLLARNISASSGANHAAFNSEQLQAVLSSPLQQTDSTGQQATTAMSADFLRTTTSHNSVNDLLLNNYLSMNRVPPPPLQNNGAAGLQLLAYLLARQSPAPSPLLPSSLPPSNTGDYERSIVILQELLSRGHNDHLQRGALASGLLPNQHTLPPVYSALLPTAETAAAATATIAQGSASSWTLSSNPRVPSRTLNSITQPREDSLLTAALSNVSSDHVVPQNEVASKKGVGESSRRPITDAIVSIIDEDSSSKRINNGTWTEEEHIQFLEGLKKFGAGKWKEIASSMIPTRTPDQTRSHAQKYFKKLEKRKKTQPPPPSVSSEGEEPEEEGKQQTKKRENNDTGIQQEEDRKGPLLGVEQGQKGSGGGSENSLISPPLKKKKMLHKGEDDEQHDDDAAKKKSCN